MPSEPSTGVSTPETAFAPKRGPGRPRSGESASPSAVKLDAGEFARSVVRLRAAKLMLGGPITPATLYGSKIGKRAAITSVVVAPWFTTTPDGQFKLTPLGRDEFVEAMDGPAPGQSPGDGPDAPVKTGRQLLDEMIATLPPEKVDKRRKAVTPEAASEADAPGVAVTEDTAD